MSNLMVDIILVNETPRSAPADVLDRHPTMGFWVWAIGINGTREASLDSAN